MKDLENHICNARVLPDLGQPEERVFLQGKQALSYQVECFGGAVLNSSTYDKELYPPVQAVKKWVERLFESSGEKE